MNDVHARAGVCPACGYRTDAVAGLATSRGPEVGDSSVCLNCAHVLIFTVTGVRSATAAEVSEIVQQPGVADSIKHIRARGFIPGYRR